MMYVTICAHCRRIKASGTETWLNLFLRLDNSLEREGMVSHGLCLDCLMTNPQYDRVRGSVLERRKKQEALA